jgi:hypothetical protein
MKFLKYKHKLILPLKDKEGNMIEKEIIQKIIVKDTLENRETAAQEAIGEIVEYDDGKPEYKAPTQLDAIEAQVTYTAMMTGTLLEE